MDGDCPKILCALIKEQIEQHQLRKSITDMNLPQLSNPSSSTALASFKLGRSIDASRIHAVADTWYSGGVAGAARAQAGANNTNFNI